MESPNLTEQNIEKIGKLFPNALTEMEDEDGNLKKGINFEMLKQELSGEVIDGEECYDFTWVGKKAAILEANTPIRKTLRPCLEESKDWENTENLYIEGDNLDVLKLLQESYLNEVKMIYIDPPYNTGKDSFVYSDRFVMDEDEYEEGIEYRDEEGKINFKQNNETNPRFHSDWCSMMYSRLKLSHSLLREDGVIFVSIDDEECHNLRKICDQIFGAENFIANIVWQKKYSPQNDAKYFSDMHDHILCYAKKRLASNTEYGWRRYLLPRSTEQNARYKNPDNDPRGPWKSSDFSVKTYSANYDYPIITPGGRSVKPPTGRCWRTSKEKFKQLVEDNRIWFGPDLNGVPAIKRFISEVQDGRVPTTWWKREDVGDNQAAAQEIVNLFEGIRPFDTPKPTMLIKQMLLLSTRENDIVLDFFSGSATTADSVMQINAQDGNKRKFIMIQIPEIIPEKSASSSMGFDNISEIGKERIRRAGEKIKQENQDKEGIENLDIGFRVLKVDSTNMKDVYYAANEYDQQMLSGLESNIKGDRTDLDLLYGVLIDWGLPLSLKHDIEEIDGVTVHTVDQGSLIACFAEHVPENVVREIAKRQPLRVVFRDSSFASSPEKINVEEIFKLLAPNTSVRVI